MASSDELGVFFCVFLSRVTVVPDDYLGSRYTDKCLGRRRKCMEGAESIGKRLKALREDNKLRQADLAREFHISNPNTISMYERDQRLPSIRTIEMYSDKFNVSIDWIIKGRDSGHFDIRADYKCDEVIEILTSFHEKAIRDVAVYQLRALLRLEK